MKKFLWPLIVVALTSGFSSAQTAVQCLVGGVWVPCSMAPQPQFAQLPVSKTGSSVLSATYTTSPVKGNTLVVVFASGANTEQTSPVSDSYSLTWFKAAHVVVGTSLETDIWYAPNTGGSGQESVMVNTATNAPVAMTIYEVPGLVYPAAASSPTGPQAVDQMSTSSGISGTSAMLAFTTTVPNEYVFAGLGLSTTQTQFSFSAPYNNDSELSTGGSGLAEFVSASLFKPDIAATNPSATWTNSAIWALAAASFKTLTVPVQGTMQGLGTGGSPSGGVMSVQGVSGLTPGTPIPVSSLQLPSALDASGNLKVHEQGTASVSVTNSSIAVTGTFWQSTQPVSAISLPLPLNAAEETGGNLATLAGTVSSSKLNVNIASGSVGGSGVFEVSPTSASPNTVSNQFFTQLSDGTHGNTINSANYNLHYGIDVNLLGLDGALFSTSNALFDELTDGTNAMGTMANFGSSPSTVKSLNVNASIFCGTTVCGTSAAPVQVSLANTGSNSTPIAVNGSGVTQPVSAVSLPLPAGAAASANQCGTSSTPCEIAGHSGAPLDQVPGSTAPANAVQIGETDGTNTRVPYLDPCGFSAWTYYPINVSANTQIVAGSGGKNVYICKLFLAPVAAAANVNIMESSTSGSACASSPTGMMGGNSAALGAELSTNGGFVLAADQRAWMKTAAPGDAVCIFASAQVTGVVAYVQF